MCRVTCDAQEHVSYRSIKIWVKNLAWDPSRIWFRKEATNMAMNLDIVFHVIIVKLRLLTNTKNVFDLHVVQTLAI